MELLGNIKNFHLYLEKSAKENTSETAFIYLEDGQTETETLTYNELRRRSHIISGYFQRNFEVDDRVILLLPNDISFIVGVFGCMYSGVIPIPLHPINNKQTLEKCKHVLKDSGTNYLLSTKKIHKSISRKYQKDAKNWNWIFIEDIKDENLQYYKQNEFTEDKVAFLQYTSGSTSQPKGVRVTHKSLITNVVNLQETFGITKDDIILSWLPFFHDMGIIAIIFQAIYTGIKCIIFPPMSFIQNPMRWLRAISKYRATMSGAPNFAYSLCAERIANKSEPLDLSCWKQAFCGAEPVKVDTYRKFTEEFKKYGFDAGAFFPGYGMAEATLLISGGVRGEVPRIICADNEYLKQNKVVPDTNGTPIISCGVSISSHEIRIVNPESFYECKENEIGEIWFKGNSVSDGYWNKPSDDVFKAKINGTKDDKLFLRTGDLGFLNNDELFVTGRLKELIIINGQNYFPKDIEELVEGKEPRIRENCTATFEFNNGTTKQLAFIAEVTRQYINRLDFQELADSIRRIISEDIGLNVGFIGILSTGRLPKTTSGKIQRKLYEQLIHKNELKFVHKWHIEQNSTVIDSEKVISENAEDFKAWLRMQVSQILNTPVEKIKNSVVLNQYGIDSLSAVGLSGQIEEYLKRSISPTVFYNYPTINAITNYLFQNTIQDKSSLQDESLISYKGSTDIAIIGIGVNFPDAKTPEEYWNNLCEGKNSITQLDENRLALHSSCRNAGFINEVDQFDAQFFNISRQEAEQIDPQHRLLMQTSYHALEDAGIVASSLKGTKTGVFIGIGNSDYNKTFSTDKSLLNSYSGLGNASSIAANRLSYFYDLKGPSLSVDTACSSSLVAVHLGVTSLLNGESTMALIGGVNLILDDSLDTVFTEAGMLSDNFQCNTFDESANGYVRGEGCGVIVVKRLANALRDGDSIRAVIKGSAINQDGTTNGITAPNASAQKAVISEAVKKAGIDIATLGYVEAHGTGTSLGDPIEVNALAELLNDRKGPCYLGAVKANIGHLEFAAGIAGLIKTTLCLQNHKIPGNPNYHKLNPLIKIDQEKIKIPKVLTNWDSEQMRRAGVSSFGFGGTNAHIILEESPEFSPDREKNVPEAHLFFTISAKSNAALTELKQHYKALLKSTSASLQDICFNTNSKREAFAKRFVVYASSKSELSEKLSTNDDQITFYADEIKTAYLFTGQGSQYAAMGKALYDTHIDFKLAIDACADWLKKHHSYDLLACLFNPEKESKLAETCHSQVTIFAVEYALANFMISLNVKPKILVGHSIGEYAAACIANVFSLEDALTLVYHRGKFMQELPDDGVMYSVISDTETIKAIIKDEPSVQIAAYNGANRLVLSGEQPVMESVINKLSKINVSATQLNVSHAFHSKLMNPAAKRFHKVAEKIQFKKPNIPIVSTLTGKMVEDEMLSPEYWSSQILNPVQFSKAVKQLKEVGINTFLEIGPTPTLTSLVRQIFPENTIASISCLKKSVNQLEYFNDAICELFVAGHNINWKVLNPGITGPMSLPLYPFQKESYWIKAKNSILSSDISALVKQLESDHELNTQEKKLLPKLLVKLKSISNIKSDRSSNLLYKMAWKKVAPNKVSLQEDTEEQLIVIEDNGEPFLIQRLVDKNEKVLVIPFNSALHKNETLAGYQNLNQIFVENGVNLSRKIRIVILLNEKNAQFQEWNRRSMLGLAAIGILLKNIPHASCWMVTKDGIDHKNKALNVANSAMWGAAKALVLDYPESFNGIINYSEPTEETFQAVINNILFEDKEQFIHLLGNQRFVLRIEPEKETGSTSKFMRYEGNYIISGGLGSLGLFTAEWLSKKGANNLILLTRKSSVEPSFIQEIKKRMDSETEVHIETCDVKSKQSVVELGQRLSERSIEVNGIIHTAGAVGEYRPEEVTTSLIEEIVNTKIIGAVNLFETFKASNLEFNVYFSSVASVWGSKNQMLYATANQYLDAYAALLKRKGVNACAIHWGPWKQSSMVNETFARKLQKNGIQLLKPAEALSSLEHILQEGLSEAIVANVDWERFSEVYSFNRKRSLFSELVQQEQLEEILKKNKEQFKRDFHSYNQGADLNTFITETIQQMTRAELGHKSGDLPPVTKGFFELGFDSITVMDLKNKIQNKVGILLPKTLLFEQPNIYTLSAYLTNQLQEDFIEMAPIGKEVSNETDEFKDMSESDLAKLLAKELENN
jgi:acyl transferase domain-containing protein/acyl-CoA synthetase (AMP-forming)/AMP-acid ligase II/acyl carrier protein